MLNETCKRNISSIINGQIAKSQQTNQIDPFTFWGCRPQKNQLARSSPIFVTSFTARHKVHATMPHHEKPTKPIGREIKIIVLWNESWIYFYCTKDILTSYFVCVCVCKCMCISVHVFICVFMFACVRLCFLLFQGPLPLSALQGDVGDQRGQYVSLKVLTIAIDSFVLTSKCLLAPQVL